MNIFLFEAELSLPRPLKEGDSWPLEKHLLIQASLPDIPVENQPFAGLTKFIVGWPQQLVEAAGG